MARDLHLCAFMARLATFLLVAGIASLSVACSDSKHATVATVQQRASTAVSIGGEFPIDPTTVGVAAGELDIAYNSGYLFPDSPLPNFKLEPPAGGGEHLVVWAKGGTVYGQRFSGDAVPLQPGPFTIGSGSRPRVASADVDRFVVLWGDDSNGGSLHATSVDIEGNVQSETLVVQGDGPYRSAELACAAYDNTGVVCLVTWWNGTEIVGLPLTLSLPGYTLSVGSELPLSHAAMHGSVVTSPAGMAPDSPSAGMSVGSQYLVAWNESPTATHRTDTVDVHAIRVKGPAFSQSTHSYSPIAVDGPDFIVAADTPALMPPSVASAFAVSWVRRASATTGEVVTRRVSGDGSLVDASPVILATVSTTPSAFRPSNGSGAIVWSDGNASLSATRMTASNDFMSLGKFAKANTGGSVSFGKVVWLADSTSAGGIRGMAAWLTNRGASDPVDRLMVAPLARDGSSLGPETIATNAQGAGTAVVTGNDHEFLVLWSGQAIRIGRDGRALDAKPLAAPNGAAASDGKDFAIVWGSGGEILGAKIAADGTVGSTKTLVTGPHLADPAIASNGANYVVVYRELATTGTGTDYLREAVLDLSLNVQATAPPPLLSEDQSFVGVPRIASDGDGYMVTLPAIYAQCNAAVVPGCGSGHFQIIGTQLQHDGSVVLQDDWQFLGDAVDDQFTVSVAPSYAAEYTERAYRSTDQSEYSALHVWPTVSIGKPDVNEDEPAIAKICDENLALWRRQDIPFPDYATKMYADIIGATVANGSATEIPVSVTQNDDVSPAVFGTGNRALIVYNNFSGLRGRLVKGDCGPAEVDAGTDGGGLGSGGSTGAAGAGGIGGSGGQSNTGGTTGAGGGVVIVAEAGVVDAGDAAIGSAGAAGTGGASGAAGASNPADASAAGGAPNTGGTSATGGTSPNGGTSATGGTSTTGGTSSTSGATGSGGEQNRDAGVADAGSGGHHGSGGGCSCRTTSRGQSTPAIGSLLGLAGIVIARRKLRQPGARNR
jgi:hypothetical protein